MLVQSTLRSDVLTAMAIGGANVPSWAWLALAGALVGFVIAKYRELRLALRGGALHERICALLVAHICLVAFLTIGLLFIEPLRALYLFAAGLLIARAIIIVRVIRREIVCKPKH